MKSTLKYTMIVMVLLLAVPAIAPALETQPQIRNEIVMKTGDKLHLFHSGTADVRQEICLNDTIPVYRELMAGGHTAVNEVGKIKVLDYAGEHYFVAEVVEGEIKVGDIAKKATASCLVQPLN